MMIMIKINNYGHGYKIITIMIEIGRKYVKYDRRNSSGIMCNACQLNVTMNVEKAGIPYLYNGI